MPAGSRYPRHVIDPTDAVLEWRKSQDDLAPNGYVDMTSAKMIAMMMGGDSNHSGGDDSNSDGMTIDGKRHCFMIVDERGAEHSFCAETHRNWLQWFSVLANHHASRGGESVDTRRTRSSGSSDSEELTAGASPLSHSPAKGAATTPSHAAPLSNPNGTGAEGDTSMHAHSHQAADRLILRVCVGSIRRLSPSMFGGNHPSRRMYFELKTGSFSRTTKTIVVSGSSETSGTSSNGWNETFNLASSTRECAPLVLTAFEERNRTLTKAKAPPKLLGSTVVSWSHFAHEECVCFWAMVRSKQEVAGTGSNGTFPLGEVKLTLQVLSPDSGGPATRLTQPTTTTPNESSGSTLAQAGASGKFHHNNQRRRASEISMVDVARAMNGSPKAGTSGSTKKAGPTDERGDGDDDEDGGFCYGSDGRDGRGLVGTVRMLFSQCFGLDADAMHAKEKKYQPVQQ